MAVLFKHLTLGGVNTLCEVWDLLLSFQKQKEMEKEIVMISVKIWGGTWSEKVPSVLLHL